MRVSYRFIYPPCQERELTNNRSIPLKFTKFKEEIIRIILFKLFPNIYRRNTMQKGCNPERM